MSPLEPLSHIFQYSKWGKLPFMIKSASVESFLIIVTFSPQITASSAKSSI
nr:MAG TPA: hypothetical protein [Caudoviricetes sp.]